MEIKVKKRDYSLDLLKIFATTIIILHHYQQGSGAIYKYINFWEGKFYFGYLVELFFILSGIFVAQNIEKISSKRITFSQFIKGKLIRLLPLLSISVLVEAGIYIYDRQFLGVDIQIGLWQIILNCLGIQNGWVTKTAAINGPTWYISILILCYFIFYVLTYLAERVKISPYYLYVCMIFLGLSISTFSLEGPFLNSNTARGYIAFFVGIFIAWLLETCEFKKLCKYAWAGLGIFIVLFVYKYNFISSGFNYLLVFFVYPAIIIILKSNFSELLSGQKWIGILGAASFDVYIWHEPLTALRNMLILQFSLEWDIKKLSSMVIFVVIAWIVGLFSYFVLEKPLGAYLKRKFKE